MAMGDLGMDGSGTFYVMVGSGWRLAGPGATSFDLRIEAGRRDAANDDSPQENTIGLDFGARW